MPEITIAVYEDFRKQGIGTLLLKAMLNLLQEKTYKKVSLRVEKSNFALKLYQSFGFLTVKEDKDDYFMVLDLAGFNKT